MDGVNLVSSVREVGLGEIGIGEERLRTLRSDTVKQLRDSMGSNGQLQPIVLRPKESGAGYWLVAGHHRLEVPAS
jgi:ParB-like chromosome segregation protein Spo0J